MYARAKLDTSASTLYSLVRSCIYSISTIVNRSLRVLNTSSTSLIIPLSTITIPFFISSDKGTVILEYFSINC